MLFEKGLRYSLEMVENLGSRAGRSLQKSSLQWYLLLLPTTSLFFTSVPFLLPLNSFHHSLHPTTHECFSSLYLTWAEDYFLALFRNFEILEDEI